MKLESYMVVADEHGVLWYLDPDTESLGQYNVGTTWRAALATISEKGYNVDRSKVLYVDSLAHAEKLEFVAFTKPPNTLLIDMEKTNDKLKEEYREIKKDIENKLNFKERQFLKVNRLE